MSDGCKEQKEKYKNINISIHLFQSFTQGTELQYFYLFIIIFFNLNLFILIGG